MIPDDLNAIEANMAAANSILYRMWGNDGEDAEADMRALVAEVRQLYRDNILLLGEGDRLRTALGDILVAVNMAVEQGLSVCQVRVIATRALLGKGA